MICFAFFIDVVVTLPVYSPIYSPGWPFLSAMKLSLTAALILTLSSCQPTLGDDKECHDQAKLEVFLEPVDGNGKNVQLTSIPDTMICPDALSNSTDGFCTKENKPIPGQVSIVSSYPPSHGIMH